MDIKKINEHQTRRYDLDWLKIIAFALLILFHIGMLYVERWGFHYKSAHTSVFLENIMLILSPWRMLLIWFISGVATYFMFNKISSFKDGLRFFQRRTLQLLLPLMCGLWVIVPIQLYAQMTQQSALDISYLEFYMAFLDLDNPLFKDYQSGVWPHVDVNHLWYLRALWRFTLILLLFSPLLIHDKVKAILLRCSYLSVWLWLVTVSLILFVINIQFDGDNVRLGQGFIVFLLGYIFGQQTKPWQSLEKHLNLLTLLFVLFYGLIVFGYNTVWQTPKQYPEEFLTAVTYLYCLQKILGVFVVLGLGQRYLNVDHPLRQPLTYAIFPSYLWHQSILILLAFMLAEQSLPVWCEVMLIIVGTYLLCAFVTVCAWRLTPLRLMFGLPVQLTVNSTKQLIGLGLSWLCVLPLMVELLL